MNTKRLVGAALAIGAGLTTILALAAPSAASAATLSPNAGNWAAASPATSPPQLTGAAMAYDPDSHQTILFGYSGGTAQTWDWNGYTWTNLNVADGPTPRGYSSLAYDPAIGDLVLFGGTAPGNKVFAETWLWNGADWTALAPVGSIPPARYDASLAYDPATSQLILFGGQNGIDDFGDTWAFESSTLTWTQLDPAGSPAPRYGASLGYDPATGQLVLYGGQGLATYADTWLWTGSNWTDAGNPSPDPAVRAFASLAYDPTTSQLILFGGENGTSFYSDTWNWTGTAWNELSPASDPGARSQAAVAYDGDTDQLVLFGGFSASGSQEADTWTYGPPPAAPGITSAGSATFTAGSAGSFSFTGSGYPLPLYTESGGLPAGVSLSPAGVLSGTPANGSGAAYDVEITASNGVGSAATQEFVLIVDQSPIITSRHSATFVTGAKGRFKVKASAYPAPTFAETGTLPAGVTLSPSGVLSGTPQDGTEGTYKIKLTAPNNAGTGRQTFTLTVAAGQPTNPPPVITSLNHATFVIASPGKFTVKANEQATFTESGALPPGLTLSPAGVLSGVPQAEGTYKIELFATNSNGTGKQAFILTVAG